MRAKCPKCGQKCAIPVCLNCGHDSVVARSSFGIGTLTCRRCEMTYSHADCPICNCQIPARAFAPPSLLVIGLILFFLYALIAIIVNTCKSP